MIILAIRATKKKQTIARMSEFLRRTNGPGWSVNPTKLVARGKRKNSLSIPKYAKMTLGTTIANVIRTAEKMYWLVANFLNSVA